MWQREALSCLSMGNAFLFTHDDPVAVLDLSGILPYSNY
jgi:hypothetical protein